MSTLTINQLYQALGRDPDPGGLTFWSGYTGPNLQSSFEAAARAAGETFDVSRVSPLNAVSSGPSTISINAPSSSSLTLSSPFKQYSATLPPVQANLNLPAKTTTTAAPVVYGPPAPVTSPLNQVSSTVPTNVASTTVDPTKTYTAQDALDYFRSTGDTVGMYQRLAASAGMPNLTDEQAAAGVVTNIAQKELGRDPDPVELKDYTEQIIGGTPYGDVLAQVQGSPEAIERQRQREAARTFVPPVFTPDVNAIIESVGGPSIFQAEPEALASTANEVAQKVKEEGANQYRDFIAEADQLLDAGLITPEQYRDRLQKAGEFNRTVEETSESIRQAVLNKDLFSLPSYTVDTDVANQIQEAAKVVYGQDISDARLRKIANDMSTGAIKADNLLAALAYGAETTEEKARANTLLGYNYHEIDPADQMFFELEDQYNTINSQTGYSYQYKDRLPTLFRNQADALAKAGVTSIYDVGVETIEKDAPINVTKRGVYDENGNFTGKFEYLKTVGFEGSGESATPIYEPLNEDELANLKEIGGEETGFQTTTTTKVLAKVLINTKTGEPLQTGFREEGALRDFNGLDIWGGANLGKGLDLFGIQVTQDGQPVFVPIWQETSDRAKIGQILSVLAAPFAPQIGAALGFTGTAATVAGATTISAASQLVSTGKLDVGRLALSAGVAYLGADIGLTGDDIAFEAARLSEMGLNASDIAMNLSAMGVNQVTSTVAANLAASGVSASLAPVITSSVINMGISGLNAALTGGDVEKALLTGAITGAGGEISGKVIDNIFGADNINAIAQEIGLMPNQVRAVGVNALSNAISAEAAGTGNFLEVLGRDLVANGMSFAAANKLAQNLDKNMDPKVRAGILTGAKELVGVSVNAAVSGADVGDAIGQAVPFIVAKSIATAVQTPSGEKKDEEKVGEKIASVTDQKATDQQVTDQSKVKPVVETPSVSGIIDGSGFKTPEEAMQWAKSQGQDKVTWDGKVYQETASKTVSGIPDGSGFKTAEEAITWANSQGENKVLWNGQVFQNQTLTETWNAIESSKTFGEAYAKARQAFGPGAIFDWNGKKYTTDTKEENPSLSQAKERIENIQQGIGGDRGTYAGYDEKEMKNLLAMIDDNAINQAVARPSGEVDFITDAITGRETPVYGDKISKDLITPVVRTVGVLTRGAGSTLDFTSGFLQSIEVIDKDSPMVNLAKELTKVGEYQIGDWALDQERQFVQKVADAEGVINKGAALAQAIIEHPMAVITLTANEAIEELPSVLAMLATGGAGGVAKLLSLGAGGITNYMEGAGANYNETKEKALASGMSEQDAHRAAQKSAAAAGATQAVLGTFAESPLIKKSFGAPGTLGTAVKREVLTEIPEEFAQTGFADYFGTGSFDLNNALTAAVIAPVIAGTAVTAIGTTISAARSGDATVEMVNAADPQQSSQVINQINSALDSSASIQDAGNKIASSLQGMGFNPEQAISIANTVATEQLFNNLAEIAPEGTGLSVNNINTLIGATASGNPVTLGDYIGASLTGKGEQMFVSSDLVIGTKSDGKLLTVGDISGALVSSNINTGIETKVETDPNTGNQTKTTVETDSNTGNTIENTVETNPNNNTTTETTIETDPNNNTTTENTVETDQNNNTTVESNVTTTQDSVVSTDTVINNNTNTQVEINSNVDANTATATVVATNIDTNVKTSIPIDNLITSLIDGGMTPIEAMRVATEEVKEAAKRGTLNARRGSGDGGKGVPMLSDFQSDFEHPSLFTKGPKAQFESPLETFLKQVQQREETAPEPQMQPSDYFKYGSPAEIDDILAQESGIIPSDVIPSDIIPSFNAPSVFSGMKAGGLVPAFVAGGPLTIAAGKVRRDYRQGDAVSGPGDGQSDDIPAMLADGEYVIDAEIVAALGNGSNKAGAELLDKFREEIRRHKRGGSLNEIPPQSKSPLQYLAAAKKKVSKR